MVGKMRGMVLTGLVSAMSLGAHSANAAATVKVGYIIPLSGSAAAASGQEMSHATQMAIRDINAAGGIASMGGAKLQLVEADSRGDPQVALTETERLIKVEKVPVIIGAYQSGITLPCTAVAEKYHVPWIVDLSAAAKITERGFHYVFRPTQIPASGNADSVLGFVKWAGEKTGKPAKSAALIYENSDWGQDMAKRLRQGFAQDGIKVVFDESYPANAPNLRPLILKLRGAHADVISVTSYTSDAIQIHKLIKSMGIKAMAVIGSGAGQVDPAFVPSVGKAVSQDVLTTAGWAGYDSTITTPFARKFWNDYVATYHAQPTEFSAVAYADVWILKDALERAGSDNPEAIRNALAATNLKETDVTKLLGYNVSFDATGQNNDKRFVVQQISGGAYHTVWPVKLAAPNYKMVWPADGK